MYFDDIIGLYNLETACCKILQQAVFLNILTAGTQFFPQGFLMDINAVKYSSYFVIDIAAINALSKYKFVLVEEPMILLYDITYNIVPVDVLYHYLFAHLT